MASNEDNRIDTAWSLLDGFAVRTGLTAGEAGQDRYLWTDAFAACTFHALAAASADDALAPVPGRLIHVVHSVLAQHRPDEPRQGWLHGPHGQASEAHPTRCGLRIGKPLPERGPYEPMDERLEWERDGQYFHYLTRWMHALDQLARAHRDARLNLWARELADAAHRAFTYAAPGGTRRMVWKMSIDLSRTLVPSMGQHDPLDGYVTARALQATATALGTAGEGPDLVAAAADYHSMLVDGSWATTDPLGIGGLLMDACRLEQLIRLHGIEERVLLDRILQSAAAGLERSAPAHRLPAERRLAFREFGLSIGMAAIGHLAQAQEHPDFGGTATTRQLTAQLLRHAGQRSTIESFWLAPENREASTWTGHRNINEVMLATSLAPDGWLLLPPLR